MNNQYKLNKLFNDNYFDRGFQIVQFSGEKAIHIYGGNWTPFSPCFKGKKFDNITYIDNGNEEFLCVFDYLIKDVCPKCINHYIERNENLKRFSEVTLKEAYEEGLIKKQ
jgi:hypothetical protein